MKIEIKTFNLGDNFLDNDQKIAIDGIVAEDSSVHNRSLYLHSNHAVQNLKQFTGTSLKELFNLIYFQYSETWCQWKLGIQLLLGDEDDDLKDKKPIPRINIDFDIDLKDWNKVYSVNDLQIAYEKLSAANEEVFSYIDRNYHPENLFGLYLKIDISDTLENILNNALSKIKLLHENVILHLEQNNLDVITTFFQFPEEIKVSCKQYLIYFGQFLEDLGLDANTSIKEEANKILFTVIPENGNEAIEKVREALEIFLNAPANEIFDKGIGDYSTSNNIAILQWRSNILHLKSQIALSTALIQAKDATIEALQLSNYRLQGINQKLLEDKKEEEKILGGVVSITKYEGKGFTVDIAEIFRRLKRKFM